MTVCAQMRVKDRHMVAALVRFMARYSHPLLH